MNHSHHPDVERAVAYAYEEFARKLSPSLAYHNLQHTFADVLPVAERLAVQCEIEPQEQQLVRVAAAFHDIGWISQGNEHEATGVKVVRAVLPDFGFSAAAIETIAGMIMATRIPHSPKNLLEEILADADLDSLGRDDFWESAARLRTELANLGEPMSNLEWYRYVLAFLESHHYFTSAARALRAAQKARHCEDLRSRIAELAG